jgi:hypothetical protein
MTNRLNASIVFLSVLLLQLGSAFGQQVVTPQSVLPLRASPPGTFFQGKGAEIGTTVPNEAYRVLEERSVPTITGSQRWLRVESETVTSNSGWVYAGPGSNIEPSEPQ